MNGLLPVGSTLNLYANEISAKCPIKEFGALSNYICTSPLVERLTNNWKVILMDTSTVIAVAGFVATFFMGSTLLPSAFLVTACASGIAAFYMRQLSTLTDLEGTAKKFRETKEKFEGISKKLEEENKRLSMSNRQLQRNNTVFEQSNKNLIQTNTRLNQQVAQLTLQVVQLRESADRIRSELICFQQENSHLHANIRGFDQSLHTLDQQILNSRALCQQISEHLCSQNLELGQQMAQLERYLSDIRADNRVNQRIQELASLQREILQATEQLHAIQLQYAAERANFQTIHKALVQLKDQFDLTLRDACNHLQTNNLQFKDSLSALASERQRIQDIINRHFAREHPGR
jgi:chromosome segregation ATPase